MVTDATSAMSWGKAALMPLATAPLARKETADAMITFADGTVHVQPLDGSAAVRTARRQCVEFNALAGQHGQAAEGEDDPAVRLPKLQELLEVGLITSAEFDSRRAAIIDSV
jgi:membrane protease subunit (stomatin/prohibitin family)